MAGWKLSDQFRHPLPQILLVVLFKGVTQPVGEFFSLQLEQDAVEQDEVRAVHMLDLSMELGLQLFRLNRYWLQYCVHGEKIAALAGI